MIDYTIIDKLIHTAGSMIFHSTYGNGTVMDSTDKTVTIQFEDGVVKRFSIAVCLQNNYLKPFQPSEKQSKKWFSSIKWTETCLDCHKKYNGSCPNRSCAEREYDEWGEQIPLHLYFHDGNNVSEYLDNKRKEKEVLAQRN